MNGLINAIWEKMKISFKRNRYKYLKLFQKVDTLK